MRNQHAFDLHALKFRHQPFHGTPFEPGRLNLLWELSSLAAGDEHVIHLAAISQKPDLFSLRHRHSQQNSFHEFGPCQSFTTTIS